MAKHKHTKTQKKANSKKLVVLFFLSLAAFALIVLYKTSGESVLGATIGGEPIAPTQSKTQITQPTDAPAPTTPQTIRPTEAVYPTITPTPTLIVPEDPIYVPIIDPTKESPDTIDIAKEDTTVVIESTSTGLVTTTQELTPRTEPVTETQTIITSQTDQTGQPAETIISTAPETSIIDKFIALFSGQPVTEPQTVQETSTVYTSPEQAKGEDKPVLYQQVYLADSTSPTYSTDSTQTIAALDMWLGLNNMTLSSSTPEEFSIKQGDVEAIINATGNKIAINLSKMEIMVNTPSGFMPLSYTAKEATEYPIDLNIASRVKGSVTVRYTPTELTYNWVGTSDQYWLAFIPVAIDKNLCVSAKTKEICGVKQSLASQLIDWTSL